MLSNALRTARSIAAVAAIRREELVNMTSASKDVQTQP
jgi:hypothetical protein